MFASQMGPLGGRSANPREREMPIQAHTESLWVASIVPQAGGAVRAIRGIYGWEREPDGLAGDGCPRAEMRLPSGPGGKSRCGRYSRQLAAGRNTIVCGQWRPAGRFPRAGAGECITVPLLPVHHASSGRAGGIPARIAGTSIAIADAGGEARREENVKRAARRSRERVAMISRKSTPRRWREERLTPDHYPIDERARRRRR